MILRCTTCQGSVPVQTDESAARIEATCKQCGQRYELAAARVRGASLKRISARARELTADHGIDLPSAYSVALDLIELERVKDVASPGDVPFAQSAAAGDGDLDAEYDPEFAPAVNAGRLTPRQAMERGQRAIYCERLRRRHRLSERMAEAVADNRMSLLQALRTKDATQTGPVRVRDGGRGASIAAIVGVAALIAIGGAGAFFGPTPEQALEAAARVEHDGAVYVTDRVGRVLRVEGPSPRSVLRTFCAVGSDDIRYEPASLVPVETPHGRTARLGLLRDPSVPDRLLAITIREDPDAGMWIADNGGRVLAAETAPDGAARRLAQSARQKNRRNSPRASAETPESPAESGGTTGD